MDLIKKPWVFNRVLNMNPPILGVIGPGFLNQVPTLCAAVDDKSSKKILGFEACPQLVQHPN